MFTDSKLTRIKRAAAFLDHTAILHPRNQFKSLTLTHCPQQENPAFGQLSEFRAHPH
jgi:hypothetical protein